MKEWFKKYESTWLTWVFFWMGLASILAGVVRIAVYFVQEWDKPRLNAVQAQEARAMQIYGECQELRGELKAYRAMAVIPSKEAK